MQGTQPLNLQGTHCQLDAEERAADRRVTYSAPNAHHSSDPLRQKRTEVTQVRRHDDSCGSSFFILKTRYLRPSFAGWCTKSPSAHPLRVLGEKRHHHLRFHNQIGPPIANQPKHLTNMQLPTNTPLTLLLTTLLTTSVAALSTQEVWNWCPDTTLYVVNVNSTGSVTGPSKLVPGGGNWTSPIIGSGNSLGVAKTDQYWAGNTTKLIWGTSTDANILYWSVGNVGGDPFAGQEKWEVTSWEGGRCDGATT
jgi:hypothetical protein